MKKRRVCKPIKAWAILDHNNYYELAVVNNLVRLFKKKSEALEWIYGSNREIVQVEIRPIKRKRG